jgi:hypothetical protein
LKGLDNGSSCANNSLVEYVEACALNGTCIGNVDLAFVALTTNEGVKSDNVDMSSATCTSPLPDAPCFGDALTLSYLAVSNSTVLGSGTSCLSPLLPSCYAISGASCNGVPVGQGCMPSNIMVDTLNAVDVILSGSNASIVIQAVQITGNITTQTLASNETYFLQNVTCASPINGGCLDLAGSVCPMGKPLPTACLPTSLNFSMLSVQTNLLLNNSFTCASPLDDATCVPGTSSNVPNTFVKLDGMGNFAATTITAGAPFAGSVSGFTGALAGDVTGTQSATTVLRIQGRTVTSTSPTASQALRYSTGTNSWSASASGLSVPSFSGDITGPIGSNTIAALQNVPVATVAPTPFYALRGTGGSTWAPASLTPVTYWKHFQLQGNPCALSGPIYLAWEDIVTCVEQNACACTPTSGPYVCAMVTNHTAPVNGVYRFHIMMKVDDTSAGHGPEIHLNGSFYAYVSDYGPTPAGPGYYVDGTTYITMMAGDYVSIFMPAGMKSYVIAGPYCGYCQPESNMDFMKYDIPF